MEGTTPDELYDRPETVFTAGFIGTPPVNLLDLADGPEGALIAGRGGRPVLGGRNLLQVPFGEDPLEFPNASAIAFQLFQ